MRDLLLLDHGARGRVFGIEYRRGCCHSQFGSHGAHLKPEVDLGVLVYQKIDGVLTRLIKPPSFRRQSVLAGRQEPNLIRSIFHSGNAAAESSRLLCGSDNGAGNSSARGICYSTRDAALKLLAQPWNGQTKNDYAPQNITPTFHVLSSLLFALSFRQATPDTVSNRSSY